MIPRKLSSEIAHKNPWYHVRHDKLEWPDGHQGEYFVVEGWTGCAVVVVQEGKLLTIKQYRYPIERMSCEIPMGRVNEGETIEQAAVRELIEEAGYQSDSLDKLGVIYPNCGVSNHAIHVFEASSVKLVGQALEKEEQGMVFEWMPLEEWGRQIEQNVIIDADSLAAWALYSKKHNL